jgi:hypothetical protein
MVKTGFNVMTCFVEVRHSHRSPTNDREDSDNVSNGTTIEVLNAESRGRTIQSNFTFSRLGSIPFCSARTWIVLDQYLCSIQHCLKVVSDTCTRFTLMDAQIIARVVSHQLTLT